MSNAERMVVVCPNCDSETKLSNLDGDRCPDCKQRLPGDATTKIPTDIVDGRWDKILGGEPAGGYDYEYDEVTKPDRDVMAISDTLAAVEQGDHVQVTLGADEFQETVVLYVVTHERDVVGFDHRLSLCPAPRDDGWTRLYTTGVGPADLDAWEVTSAPYDLEGDGTLDARDYAAHGWILDARPTDDSVTPVDGGPE